MGKRRRVLPSDSSDSSDSSDIDYPEEQSKKREFTMDTIRQLSIKKLKKYMVEDGVSYDPKQVIEKEDLIYYYSRSGKVKMLADPNVKPEVPQTKVKKEPASTRFLAGGKPKKQKTQSQKTQKTQPSSEPSDSDSDCVEVVKPIKKVVVVLSLSSDESSSSSDDQQPPVQDVTSLSGDDSSSSTSSSTSSSSTDKKNALKRKMDAKAKARARSSRPGAPKSSLWEDDEASEGGYSSSSSEESDGGMRNPEHQPPRSKKKKKSSLSLANFVSGRQEKEDDDESYDDDDDFIDDGSDIGDANDYSQIYQSESDSDDDVLSYFQNNKNRSQRENFDIWLDDICQQAQHHLTNTNTNTNTKTQYKSTKLQKNAGDSIEKKINTVRESSLAGGWKPEYKDPLSSRCVFTASQGSTKSTATTVCEACGKSGHGDNCFAVVLSGPTVVAKKSWESDPRTRCCDWTKVIVQVPAGSECNSESDSDSENENESENGSERKFEVEVKPTEKFNVGGTCTPKSKRYHELLHYKFRLFDSCLAKLRGDKDTVARLAGKKENGGTMDGFLKGYGGEGGGGESKTQTVEQILKEKFVDAEYARYCKLIDTERVDGNKFIL